MAGTSGSARSGRSRAARIPGERAVLAAMGVDSVGSGMYVPFSLVFFHRITGLSFAVVGSVMTVTGLAGMAALPLAGAAVDRYGARRVQLLLYGVRGGGFALYPFATALPAFAAVALGTAFGDRAFPAVQQSFIGEVARGADRDRLLAASRALRNGGLGAGALLASLIVTLAGDRGFVLGAWLNAASFGAAALLMRRVRAADTAAAVAPGALVADAESAAPPRVRRPSGYRLVLADRPFLGLTAVNFLVALGYASLSVLFPLFIAGTLGGPQALTGAAFTVNTVLCGAGGVAVAGAVRRTGARRTRAAALGSALFGVSFAGLAVLGSVRPHSSGVVTGLLLGLVTLYTLAELVHNPAAGTLAMVAAPDALRGRYMAAYQLSWSLASTLAPSLFTALISADARLPWLVLTATALSAAALLLRLERHLPREAVLLSLPTAVASGGSGGRRRPQPARPA